MDIQSINKRIAEVNPERLEAYQRMFDRILLYTLAANFLPQEHLKKTLDLADKVIKRTIDVDSCNRTRFLQETKEGRVERMKDAYDGEDVRLISLKTWELAKELITSNLSPPSEKDEN